MNIRETTESIERKFLSEGATFSAESKGRRIPETACELRTEFQRDRDRIIHSKAFRRLKHKTQVFLAPESDHYRTRLTHTLEVSQIARTISRALRINEDLTEAIALGHDLGHTPFGHAGERALNAICGNFTHFEQSVRVCETIEKNGNGLNLTFEVLDGILHHTRGDWAETLEGKVVRFSDRIAYINHDIEDAVRAGIIKQSDLPSEVTRLLGDSKTRRINTLVTSIVENSDKVSIKMNDEISNAYELLHRYLFDSVYTNRAAKAEEDKVQGIVEGLYDYFLKHPEKISEECKMICEKEGVERAVIDYIAGMTDHFAISKYSEIYIPKFWKI